MNSNPAKAYAVMTVTAVQGWFLMQLLVIFGIEDGSMKPLQWSAPITLGAHSHEIDEKDLHLLERAAEKLVRFGKQVGVTPEGDDLVAGLQN